MQKETIVVANMLLGESLVIAPGETLEIPFEFVLPHETPISIGVSPIWVRTGLDIDNAVDPSDRDDIEVQAHPHTAVVFEVWKNWDFICIKWRMSIIYNVIIIYRLFKSLNLFPIKMASTAARWMNLNSSSTRMKTA